MFLCRYKKIVIRYGWQKCLIESFVSTECIYLWKRMRWSCTMRLVLQKEKYIITSFSIFIFYSACEKVVQLRFIFVFYTVSEELVQLNFIFVFYLASEEFVQLKFIIKVVFYSASEEVVQLKFIIKVVFYPAFEEVVQLKFIFIFYSARVEVAQLKLIFVFYSASEEVVVYGCNIETYSNDAFLAFPVDVIGDEYYAVSHYPSTYECEFLVVGVTDDTTITIQLGSHSAIEVYWDGTYYFKDDTFTVTVDRFDTLQVCPFVCSLYVYHSRHDRRKCVFGYMRTKRPRSACAFAYQQPLSSNLIGWKLEVGVAS